MSDYDEWKLASPPDEPDKPCPCCNSTTWERIFMDYRGMVVGCSDCLEEKAWEDVDVDDIA